MLTKGYFHLGAGFRWVHNDGSCDGDDWDAVVEGDDDDDDKGDNDGDDDDDDHVPDNRFFHKEGGKATGLCMFYNI